MADKNSPFDEAADVLQRAMKATDQGQQNELIDEALRLNAAAVSEDRKRAKARRREGAGED